MNTKPLLYGIRHSEVAQWIDLSVDYPAEVGRKLKDDEIDLGLVPVAILPELKEYFIDADYCIGANGPVGSVAIFSDVPIEEVTTVLLDYQSRTSVALTRILLKYYWRLSPELVPAKPGFLEQIGGRVAGVVIGDRAFLQKQRSLYEYDLSEAWKTMTGLPFVFAAWVANKELPEDFVAAFNLANEWGLANLDLVVAEERSVPFDLKKYYTQNISYRLDESKRAGMQLFMEYLKKIGSPKAVLIP